MPIVKLENGTQLKFDDSYTDDQIGQAVDEYMAGEVSEINSEQTPKQNQSETKESFLHATDRIADEFAMGLPQGLGDLAIGATQLATDIIAPNSQFSKNLAAGVKERNNEQMKLPTSERVGIMAGETLPFLTTGVGVGAKVAAKLGGKGLAKLTGGLVGAGIGGAAAGSVSPSEETGLVNRTKDSLVDAGVSMMTFGALKGAQKVVSPMVSRFLPAQKQAITKLRNDLATEGMDAGKALKELEETGLDLIDVVDPRFRAKNDAVRFLKNKETIKDTADESLAQLNKTADKLQDKVVNMISTNKIDPVEAGNILGKNAQKIIDSAKSQRTAATESLYKEGEKGLADLKQIVVDNLTPEEAKQFGLNAKQTQLTLNDLLKSPIIQESINIARSKSEEFSKTLGSKIYGNIYGKTKPVYKTSNQAKDVMSTPVAGREFDTPISQPITREVKLGAAANSMETEYSTKTQLKTPANYETPDHAVKVLSAVDKILNDKIGNIELTGSTAEQTALKLAKSGLEKVLDEANPTLKEARNLWRQHSDKIEKLSKSSIGKIAKQYAEGKSDDLANSAMDVLRLKPERIAQLRTQNPERFNDMLANSIEARLATNIIDQPKAFHQAIFGKDNGLSLRAALGDDRASYAGLQKLAQVLDAKAERVKITQGAMEEVAKRQKAPLGKFATISHAVDTSIKFLTENPKVQKEFVRLMFTKEGKSALRQIAKTPSKEAQQSIADDLLLRAISLANAGSK